MAGQAGTAPTGPTGPPAGPPAAPFTREIRINPLTAFDGNRKKYTNWLQSVVLYISLNGHIYQNDDMRVGYAVSFLSEKEASTWREAWIARNSPAGVIIYPTWAAFIIELDQAFMSIDAVGNAMHAIQTLQQGSKTLKN